MNEEARDSGTMEIDLKRLAEVILKKSWLVAVVAVLCAVLAFVGTFYFVTPQYQASAMFYVNNSVSVGGASLSISSGDIVASKNLVKTYMVILKTRETMLDVIDYAGVDCSYGRAVGMVQAESVNETEIFRIKVTSPDPVEAKKLADSIAYILPKRISSIVEGTSAKVVDSAVFPSSPVSPSYSRNAALGFVIGLLLTAGILVVRELLNVLICTEEDIARISGIPVLAAVPDMDNPGKGSRYKYARSYTDVKPEKPQAAGGPVLMGEGVSFVASEAYKLLRTKLQYSFADGNVCHVVGVSSAVSGEGKSLTAINLAHAIAQLDKKVLLIDCDMRRPSLSVKLPIVKYVGLSGYLTGLHFLEEIIQKCDLKGENTFDIIAAGQNPPNPIELLSSAKMTALLAQLRKMYDYVILDLPPVGEVSDALAVAKETDGILLVVRRNFSSRPALTTAIHQFTFVGAKLIGYVFNCAASAEGTYAKSYYKRGYGRYAGKYASTWAKKTETGENQEKA